MRFSKEFGVRGIVAFTTTGWTRLSCDHGNCFWPKVARKLSSRLVYFGVLVVFLFESVCARERELGFTDIKCQT